MSEPGESPVKQHSHKHRRVDGVGEVQGLGTADDGDEFVRSGLQGPVAIAVVVEGIAGNSGHRRSAEPRRRRRQSQN